MSQAATVTHLFAARNARSHLDFSATNEKKANAEFRPLNALPLQSNRAKPSLPSQKTYSAFTILLVVTAHIAVIYWLSAQKPVEEPKLPPAKPMMVSLIAPPAPKLEQKPELLPLIEPIKKEIKPIAKPTTKPKKRVEKIKPIETPAERLIEATIEEPIMDETPAMPIAPVKVAEAPKAAPVIEKVAEEKPLDEKIEPPRFGVSYLNNPAPDYPATSRRLGEEGRVLMKVLVSADGTAEDVQIEKSSGSERLDDAAIKAVKRWRFIPAKKNNQALSAYVMVPMKFSLDS